jgi:hypothetical protein
MLSKVISEAKVVHVCHVSTWEAEVGELQVRDYPGLCTKLCLKKIKGGGVAGKMTQQLRALAALPEVQSLIPSNHMVAHNHL